MAQTEFTIYKYDKDNSLLLEPQKYVAKNTDWRQFLIDTNQEERLHKFADMSARKRSPKVWRLRQTSEFLKWSENHRETVEYKPYAIASATYDGRIPEGRIKYAILDAVKYGEKEARYYPQSNQTKPAHLQMVYCFTFNLKML